MVRPRPSTLQDGLSRHTATRQWSKDLGVCTSAVRARTYLSFVCRERQELFYSEPKLVYSYVLQPIERERTGRVKVAHEGERENKGPPKPKIGNEGRVDESSRELKQGWSKSGMLFTKLPRQEWKEGRGALTAIQYTALGEIQ
jgi:hypothetical protein